MARSVRIGSIAFLAVLPALLVAIASLWMYLNPGVVSLESVSAGSVWARALVSGFYLSAAAGLLLGGLALARKEVPRDAGMFAVIIALVLLILDRLLRS